ncbi:rod shape-determining protein MreD [Lederbergia sp. NSJ-179]|uniref:rod shape-determining protein MreD n=1 Tax=Lederbergia sp. NSJ-179 TaxID=2931402 RepID=UPI001FCFF39C|nr:rod shape-determining protein MreD [Lederbergia sp. NSJ-179]MCJ7839902.1 rod shape-determining protein MreD [Lederbergia sp. NSJ-179]
MRRLVLPLLLTVCFYCESVFVELTPPGSFKLDMILVPHFLLILFVVMGILYLRNRTLIYAAVFGLLFDVYFTEIIGVYLFLFPIVVYLASKMAKIFQVNIFTVFFIAVLSVGIVELVVYGMNIFVLQRNMDIQEYLNRRLWPTLILNQIFFLITYFPFKKFLFHCKKEELRE